MLLQNRVNHIRIAEHFYLDEFQCPCCQQVMLHSLLLQKLKGLRYKIQKPVIITSGYRCLAHNQVVGGVKNSYHLSGIAVDLYVPELALSELLKATEEIGFSGIGYYPDQNFLHLDIRPAGTARWQG
jgi:uncharacterized protein YcbK (DUF882 family)